MLLRNDVSVRVLKSTITACAAMAVCGMVRAAGASETINNANSTVVVNPNNPAGVTSWLVDQISQLGQESLFFSVGNNAPQPISNLDNTSNTLTANVLTDSYTGVGFTLRVVYNAVGGSAGSGNSAIGETIVLSNTTAAPINLHVYDYTAFTVNGNAANNIATPSGSPTINTIDQTNPATGAVGEVDAVSPDHYEIAVESTLLSALNNGSNPVTLSDSTIPGPGNPNFAFEWDPTLQAMGLTNSSDIISINKSITGSIPLPPAVWTSLTTLAGIALVAAVRRRKHIFA